MVRSTTHSPMRQPENLYPNRNSAQNPIGGYERHEKKYDTAVWKGREPFAKSGASSRDDQDPIRVRLVALERRQESMETTFKICSFVFLTIGLGALVWNRQAVQDAATEAYKNIPTWQEIQTSVGDKFTNLFKRTNP